MIVVFTIVLANFTIIGTFLGLGLHKSNPSARALGPAGNFIITDVQGKQISLSDFNGRVVVLEFFETQCPWCRAEVTELKQVYNKYGDNIVILSISINPVYDTDQKLLQFMNETGITWTVAGDTNNVHIVYNVIATPTTYIIDKAGCIQFIDNGETTADNLSQEIMKLL